MPYVRWLLIVTLFPVLAWAEYNPEAIKRGITEQKKSFLVESWRKSENGEAWIANTTSMSFPRFFAHQEAAVMLPDSVRVEC